MILIDKLAYSSAIRHRNTGVKCAFALGTLLICVGVRTLPVAAAILLVMGVLTMRWSSVSGRSYAGMMAAPLVFLMLGTVVVAFDFSLEGITYTTHSLLYALRLVAVSLAAVSCLYFLTLTTPTLDTMGLLKKIHCPWIIIELMVLIYRFIFVLMDLALSITTSQNSRMGNRNLRIGIRSMGQMMARVLVIAMYKSSLLFDAMEARCYDGKMQVIFTDAPPRAGEIAGTAVFLLVILSLGIFTRLYGGAVWAV